MQAVAVYSLSRSASKIVSGMRGRPRVATAASSSTGDQSGVVMVAHGPADQVSGGQVEHAGHTASPRRLGRRSRRAPDDIGPVGVEQPADQVRCGSAAVSTVTATEPGLTEPTRHDGTAAQGPDSPRPILLWPQRLAHRIPPRSSRSWSADVHAGTFVPSTAGLAAHTPPGFPGHAGTARGEPSSSGTARPLEQVLAAARAAGRLSIGAVGRLGGGLRCGRDCG